MTLWADREFGKGWLARLVSTAGSAALVRTILRPLNLTRPPRSSLEADIGRDSTPCGGNPQSGSSSPWVSIRPSRAAPWPDSSSSTPSGCSRCRSTTTIGLSAWVGVMGLLVGIQLWWLAVLSIALWGLTSTIVIVNGITVRQLITLIIFR